MKKSTIWILGIVMGLSFLSLLYLQISYIEEMAKMRNEQFDESVKRALMAASKSVEAAEVDRWLREDISEADKRAWEQRSQGNSVVHTQRFQLISPDGERTMITHLGAALELTAQDLSATVFEGFDCVYIEGYLVQNHRLIEQAARLAKEKGLVRSEGKEYVVKDGDVMHFLFNV